MSHLSLGDYGLIGNGSSAALVSRLGSIDWCCLPYLDSASHFSHLVDDTQGGRFQIMPQGEYRSEQHYLQRTLVLETVFETPHGRGVLTDWMPLASEPGQDHAQIRRRLEVIEGEIPWQLNCVPRMEYGTQATEAEYHRNGVLFRGASGELALLQSDLPIELMPNGNGATARFLLSRAEKGPSRAEFSWSWDRGIPSLSAAPKETIEQWHHWAHRCPPSGCPFAGPWHDLVARSTLLLRILGNCGTGGVAESVTSSIPGVIPGSRNWDFRYAWIRDSGFTMRSIAKLGHADMARALFLWLSEILLRDGAASLQPVYRLDGGRFLPEREVPSLRGYHGSRPFRVGNLSAGLFQLDAYGHLLLAAAEYRDLFGQIPDEIWEKLTEVADMVCQAWRRPDHGPWESRSKSEHYVSSKVVCWAGLDRICKVAQAQGVPVPSRWEEEKKILHRTICNQGYDPMRGCFVRSFGDREIDASAMLIPLLDFLPWDDARVESTLHTLREELFDGVLMYRYRSGDGIPGPDGAHLGVSFRFVSCLARSGHADEAADRLAELCTHATPFGLFGEQVDTSTGETTGNFPCASAHLALTQAVLDVAAARGKTQQPSIEWFPKAV